MSEKSGCGNQGLQGNELHLYRTHNLQNDFIIVTKKVQGSVHTEDLENPAKGLDSIAISCMIELKT